MSNLQPKQFQWSGEGEPWFHGSRRNLTPGVDNILPANDVGGSNYGYSKHDPQQFWDDDDEDLPRGDYTFAADTEEEAESWVPYSGGRQVTYVVDAQSQPYHDFEDQHHNTNYGEGTHIKVPGPMPIVDRIDIPRPNHEGQVVQGTLPPQNWGHFNALPKGYEGPATMGEQFPERDNFLRINPAGQRTRQEWAEEEAVSDAIYKRHDEEQAWKKAGQRQLPGLEGH